ncbi:MAG: DUF5110 domain-containing protein [Oscillospiraceae bacterium]|nr:DUF5110 domain-containing protein [Oscillospiraceae bacterium]
MKERLLPLLCALALLIGCGGVMMMADNMPGLPAMAASPPIPDLAVGASGRLRVSVCTDSIIRARYSPNGVFSEKDKDAYNTFAWKFDWEPVEYTVDESASSIVVTTAKLIVTVNKTTGYVSYADIDGLPLTSETNRTSSNVNISGESRAVYAIGQQFSCQNNEYLYGFGNINGTVGIRGQNIELRQTNVEKRTPMFFSNMGYGIFFDVTSNATLSWSGGSTNYTYTGRATDTMDYYFLYGPEPDGVISGYRTVTGQAAMLPKSAFGYVQSRNRYNSWDEMHRVTDRFRREGIPLDQMVVDFFWYPGNKGFMNVMEWRPEFANPSANVKLLHDKNVAVSVSVWPSFGANSPTYSYITQNFPKFLFPDNNPNQFGYVYDPTSAENRKIYWDLINDNVSVHGFDTIWQDATEPETSRWSWNDNHEITSIGSSRLVGLKYSLYSTQAVYEGQRSVSDDKRVNSLSRSAVAGVQRYGVQSWSGDIAYGFNQLRQEIRGVMNFSASGIPYFSTDTGGYHAMDNTNPNDREMFLRWLQYSTFNSIMRVHGEGSGKEPWQMGMEYQEYITDYINLRQRLMPYIYSVAGAVTQNDYSMVRPLVFDFREDITACRAQDQLMFGPSIMACPVSTLGQRERSVYFPEGRWINFWTGESFDSYGMLMTVDAPLRRIPLFIRAGGIIPMGPFTQHVNEKSDPVEIRVYMGADGSFNFYEDEGNNYNYEQGAFTNIPFTWDETAKTLTIGARAGSFEGMLENRTFHIVFVQPDYGHGITESKGYQQTVAYDGAAQTVAFDPNWVPPIPDIDKHLLPKPTPGPLPGKPDRAMVGEWSFDDGQGALITDTSGFFNHASLVSGSWVAGKAGDAIQLSSANGNYAEAEDSPSLGMTDAISFSCFINYTGGGFQNIVNKGGNGMYLANPGFSMILIDGNLQVEIQSPKSAAGTTERVVIESNAFRPIPRNSWVHVGFTWQSKASGGDGILRLYVNGNLASAVTAANTFNGPIGTTPNGLRFGCSDVNEPAFPNYFNGMIDEAKLFNYALTAEEMTALSQLEQTVVLANPTRVTTEPGDGKITLEWGGVSDISLISGYDITIQSLDGSYAKSYPDVLLPPFEMTGLNNGEYYRISIKTAYKDGRKSPGVYVVGYASDVTTEIRCLATHANKLYGYIVNHSGEKVYGNLNIVVYRNNKAARLIHFNEEYVVPGKESETVGMRMFEADIGAFAEGQVVQVTFDNWDGPSAEPKLIKRDLLYTLNNNDREELESYLNTLLQRPVPAAPYTAASIARYNGYKTQAAALYASRKGTITQLQDAIEQLGITAHLPAEWFYPACVAGNREYSVTDARLILQHLVGKITLTGLPLAAADIDWNGTVQIGDARLLLQKLVGKQVEVDWPPIMIRDFTD